MVLRDPNIAKLQLVAHALGSLREQVVFVGGCAVGLLITDEAAAPVRATSSAQSFKLPNGDDIRLIAAPVFVATKFEAHADRGAGDLLASHDLEDIVNVIDGRPGLRDEIATSPRDLREYLAQRCSDLLAPPLFADYLPGLIASGEDQSDRVQLVYERIRAIAG